MGAVPGDAAVLHHEDLVGVLNGGQPVGDGDDGLAPGQLGNGLLDEVLVLRVNAGGCLVQNDDGRVFQDGPGDGDALLLAAGQALARLARRGVVALGQFADKLLALGGSGSSGISRNSSRFSTVNFTCRMFSENTSSLARDPTMEMDSMTASAASGAVISPRWPAPAPPAACR